MAIRDVIRNNIRRMVGGTFSEPIPSRVRPEIELVYWRPGGGENFGDALSAVVVTKILADREYFLREGVRKFGRLLALGSILHFAKDGDTVWGSGFNGKVTKNKLDFARLDVRAVRGPLTRELLEHRAIKVPEVYGDPALLLPRLLPARFRRRPGGGVLFVPHFRDAGIVEGFKNELSPLEPWNVCVQRILESDLVVASSLHALIVAEAYGIPARYVRLSEHESIFKYNDYYLGTGRQQDKIAMSVSEAAEMGGLAPPEFNASKLLEAFPFDLWQ